MQHSSVKLGDNRVHSSKPCSIKYNSDTDAGGVLVVYPRWSQGGVVPAGRPALYLEAARWSRHQAPVCLRWSGRLWRRSRLPRAWWCPLWTDPAEPPWCLGHAQRGYKDGEREIKDGEREIKRAPCWREGTARDNSQQARSTLN